RFFPPPGVESPPPARADRESGKAKRRGASVRRLSGGRSAWPARSHGDRAPPRATRYTRRHYTYAARGRRTYIRSICMTDTYVNHTGRGDISSEFSVLSSQFSVLTDLT